jgi:hypothetical protein
VMLTGLAQAQTVKGQDTVQMDYSALVVSLEQTGLQYQKMSGNVWTVSAKFEDRTRTVTIVANRDVVSLLHPIAKKPDKISPELLGKLADLNNKYYFMKFVYDDSNLYLRVDVLLSGLNGNVLMNMINRIDMSMNEEGEELTKLAGAAPVEPAGKKK